MLLCLVDTIARKATVSLEVRRFCPSRCWYLSLSARKIACALNPAPPRDRETIGLYDLPPKTLPIQAWPLQLLHLEFDFENDRFSAYLLNPGGFRAAVALRSHRSCAFYSLHFSPLLSCVSYGVWLMRKALICGVHLRCSEVCARLRMQPSVAPARSFHASLSITHKRLLFTACCGPACCRRSSKRAWSGCIARYGAHAHGVLCVYGCDRAA